MKTKTRRRLDLAKDVIQVLANIAVIAAVIFAVVQIMDYRVKGSAELTLVFEEYLDDEPYLRIFQVLDTSAVEAKIFKPDGPFTVSEIERYLGTLETLGDLYDHGLIKHEMLENSFSYHIQKAYGNIEIRTYIIESRQENPRWWKHFVKMAEMFQEDSHN